MALHRKWARLQALGPDLSIVQECASPAILAGRGVDLDPARCLWAAKSTARDANKGLGVFAGEGIEIRPAPLWPEIAGRWAEQSYRLDLLLPFEVIRPRRLNVLAVWSFNNRGMAGRSRMLGPVLIALDELGDWLRAAPSLVIGDFNNHGLWDRTEGANSFACHLTAFDEIGFRSAYHHLGGGDHGAEGHQTILWRPGKAYHIDYAFGSEALLRGAACHIEPLNVWCGVGGVSDHAPLVLDHT